MQKGMKDDAMPSSHLFIEAIIFIDPFSLIKWWFYRNFEREKKKQKVLKTSGKQIEKWDDSHRRYRTFISDSESSHQSFLEDLWAQPISPLTLGECSTVSFSLIDSSDSMKFTCLIQATSIKNKIALTIQFVA